MSITREVRRRHGILGSHGQYQLAAVPFAWRVGMTVMTLGEK